MVEQHIESGAGVTVAGDPRAARAGRPVRRHRDRRRRHDDRRLPREAQGRRRACPTRPTRSSPRWATTSSPPTRSSTPSPPTPTTGAPRHDMGGNIIPMLVEPRRGPRLRLRHQPRPRRDRARPRLLARRRHARRLLRRPHGPDLGPPGLQPVQPDWPIHTLARAAAAGQVRVRRRRTARGQALDSMVVRGRDRLRRHGAPLGALARRARPLPRRGRGLRAHARRRGRHAARSCAARSSTRTSRSRRAPRSASTRAPTASGFTVSDDGVVVDRQGRGRSTA